MTLTIVIGGLIFAVSAVAVAIFFFLSQPRQTPTQYYAPDEETSAADRLLRHRGG
ncbi:MAG TPA: hypothetical protein V6C69_22850 [Trichormus sp.]